MLGTAEKVTLGMCYFTLITIGIYVRTYAAVTCYDETPPNVRPASVMLVPFGRRCRRNKLQYRIYTTAFVGAAWTRRRSPRYGHYVHQLVSVDCSVL